MASTVGISGFVDTHGRVYGATVFFTQDVPVRTLSLAESRTPATAVGFWPELVIAGAAGAALVLPTAVRRLAREPATGPVDDEQPVRL